MKSSKIHCGGQPAGVVAPRADSRSLRLYTREAKWKVRFVKLTRGKVTFSHLARILGRGINPALDQQGCGAPLETQPLVPHPQRVVYKV